MSWLIKFIQKGGTVKGAIREFFNMNGRMPRTSEMNKILQTFGDKGNLKGWTPRVVEGGKSEQKMGLGQFTKKEDIYESLIGPKMDEAAVDFVRRTEGEEAAQAFKKRLIADNEQQLKVRMEIENKEAAERIRKKKAEEEFFTDERPPKDPEFASGGIAGQLHLHEGGRVALGKGGPPNPGRRNFMKLAAGLASLPFVGKFFKLAKPAAKIAQLKNTTTTMPAWFPNLVDKFIKKGVGTKVDADIMRYKAKELPGVKLEVESSGRVRLEGKNAYKEPYEIDYTPPGYEVLDEVKGKAVKTKGDFVATDTQYRRTGPEGDDFDLDGVNVNSVDELLGGSSTKLEGFAKGTGKTKKTIGQKRIDDSEYYNERADVHDPYESMDPTDFAKGGRASFTKGGLANILRT